MKKNYIVALLCAVTLSFANCGGKKGASGAHVKIPQDVSFVASFDLAQIQKKAGSFKDLAKSEAFKALKEEGMGKALKLGATIDNALEALDLNQKAYTFVQGTGKDGYIGLSFMIADEAKFKKIFDKMEGIKPSFKNEGGIQIANLAPFFPVAIGYKGKTGLILSKDMGFADNGSSEEGNTSLDPDESGEPKKREETKAKKITDEEMKKAFLKVFNTSDKESLQVPTYTEGEAKGYDIAFWYDIEKVQKMTGNNGGTPAMNELAKKFKGTNSVGFKFENGEIVTESNSVLDKELVSKYGGIMSKSGNDKLASTFPIKQVTAVMGMSLGMKELFSLIKESKDGLEGMEASIRENELDVKPQDIFEMFDGNFAVAVGKINAGKLMEGKAENVELVASFGVAKQDLANKLIKKGVQKGQLKDEGKGVYIAGAGDAKGYIVSKNNNLYVTSTESLKNDIVSGKGGMDVANLKDGMGGMYFNLETIIPIVFNVMNQEVPEELKLFKDLSSSAPVLKGNSITSKTSLRFKSSKNSLAMIMEMIQKAAQKQKSKELSLR